MSDEESEDAYAARWDDEMFQNVTEAFVRSLAVHDGKYQPTDYDIADLQNIGHIVLATRGDTPGHSRQTDLTEQLAPPDTSQAPPPPLFDRKRIFDRTVVKRSARPEEEREAGRRVKPYDAVTWFSCKRPCCLRASYDGERGHYCCRTCEKPANTFLDYRHSKDNGEDSHGSRCNWNWINDNGWKNSGKQTLLYEDPG